MTDKQTTLAYFGHHKCGSKMIMGVLERVTRYLGLHHENFHSPKLWGFDTNALSLLEYARREKLDIVSYTGADARYMGDREGYRGFHVVRDPRDIVVSSYFSHLHSHSTEDWPELSELRKVLKALPKDEGILENMKFTEILPIDGWKTDLFRTLRSWDYRGGNILELRFEDLVADPYQGFLRIFEHLNLVDGSDSLSLSSLLDLAKHKARNRYPSLPLFSSRPRQIPGWVLLSFVYDKRFSKLSAGRSKGQENVTSHYRKGESGDWKNHFTEAHKAFFKEHYNDLLVTLGYETDDRW
jgi:hypothetical protein